MIPSGDRPPGDALKILIADDHALFRQSLRALLVGRGHEVVGEARTGREALALAGRLRPDLVLMDIEMPEMDGIEATQLLAADHPEIRVVILTGSDDDARLFDAIRFGAQGYLLKSISSEQFFPLVEGVLRGEPALSPSLARRMMRDLVNPRTDQGASLTEREREILTVMAEGVTSDRALAKRLNISPNTIKFHIHNVLAKLHLANRAEAVSFALRHRVVEMPRADSKS